MVSFVMTACQKNLSFSYLVRHPSALKKEIIYCRPDHLLSSQDNEKIKYCQMVMVAAERLLSVLTEQQENPEKFGEKLLNLQTTLHQTKHAFDVAEKDLMTLQKQHASSTAISEGKERRDRLKKRYDEQKEEIQVMLAVIGINSPE
jgi:hypothetical protein